MSGRRRRRPTAVSIVALVVGAVAAALLTVMPATASPQATGLGSAQDEGQSQGPHIGTPALRVPRARLRTSVECSARVNPRNPRRTVLLVHGTGATAEEAWSWGYQRALTAEGFGVCTVELPKRAFGDVTIAGDYTVFATRLAYRRSHRRIALVGHSQGGAIVHWAATFYGDLDRKLSDVVGLAAPLDGTTVANTLCAARRCATIAWQLRRGSSYIRALRRAPRPSGPDLTSIATRLDELITPQPAAGRLPGVRSILVQDVCPGHVVEHGLLLGDAVGYALVRDAITHRGPADRRRISRGVCTRPLLPHADPVGAAAFVRTVAAFVPGLLNPLTWVDHEPRLPAYARQWLR